MTMTPEPKNEAARLRALREHEIMDTLPEPVFDEIVHRAAALCETPIALLTLVDERRQWFKARIGFVLPEIPRSIGFDAIAIGQEVPLIVRDASEDSRFSCDPLVLSELNIRFYAGVPLITDDGYAIGALSVMDYTARELSPSQIKALTDLARQAMDQLSHRRRLNKEAEAGSPAEPVKIVPSKATADTEYRMILPDVMMRFGRDLRYSYVSPFSIETIGLRPDSLLGREVGAERVPVAFADPLKSALERAVQNRRIEEIEFHYMSPSGERLFQTRLMPELSGGEVNGILSITREIVPDEREMPEPAPSLPPLRALLGLAIAESTTIPELLSRCARALVEFSGAPVVRIWLRDTRNSTLQLRAMAGDAAGLIAGDPGMTAVPIPEDADTLDELAKAAFALEAADAGAHGLTATDALPLKTGSSLRGIVTLRSHAPLPDDIRDQMLESSGTIAMSLRRGLEAEELTEQATELAKELLDAKLELQRGVENTASLAHELRTPLNSVLGLTNLLLDTPLEPNQRELGEMTRTSARALLHLLNETLHGPKKETGDLTLATAPFELREVVEDVGAMLAAKAQGKGLDLVVRCSPDLPERLIGDAGRIRQIVTNLVENAIKFTHEGFVLIDASVSEIADGLASIAVEVEDTGIGISPQQQEAVFDRYFQSGSIPASGEHGVGLGLAISREFAEKMGGTIMVRSQLDDGSIFRLTLRLPIDRSAQPAAAPKSLEGLRVLIADGPQLQQFAARELMVSWGMRVDLCSTVGEMLDSMQQALDEESPYQAVLLDERMAGSNSRGVISAVLTTSAFKQAKLVVLTSVGRNRDVERMVAEGLAVTITKPIRLRRLLETLTTIAGDLPARAEPPADVEPVLPTDGSPADAGAGLDAELPIAEARATIEEHREDAPSAAEQPANKAIEPSESVAQEPEAASELQGFSVPAESQGQNTVEATSAQDSAAGEPVVAPGSVDKPTNPTIADAVLSEPEDSVVLHSAAAEPVELPAESADTIAAPAESTIADAALRDAEPVTTTEDTQAEAAVAPTQAESALPAGVDKSTGHYVLFDPEDSHDQTFALVIEDDLVNQRVARMMLENLGCVVDVASSGEEAIALFETRVYDLVLVDCRMSGMDGYQTAAALRKMEAGERHTPIVAVTADTSEGVRERCLAAGMDAYIAKPIHVEDLQYEIEKLLNPVGPVREERTLAPIEDILDRRALMARVAGNTDVLRSLANLCQAECARLMSEIRLAIGSGDRSEFLRATHKLRGNIMSMEARAAVEAVRRLELTANQGRPADAEEMLEPLQSELERLLAAMNAILDEADAAAEPH